MNDYLTLVMTLFLLSMISERIADLLKNFLSENNTGTGYAIGRWLGFGNLLSKGPANSMEEARRAYRILKINLGCGYFTAIIFHANLFEILSAKGKSFDSLGWKDITFTSPCGWIHHDHIGHALVFILGTAATGLFLSFGSKFWHDLLDILYQSKNLKRTLIDAQNSDRGPGTPQAASVNNSSQGFLNAFANAKTQFRGNPDIVSTGLGQDENGFFIDVATKGPPGAINPSYVFQDGGQTIVLPVKVRTASQQAAPLAMTLGNKVFVKDHSEPYGTFGCLVKPLGPETNERYLLTCCHNVVVPISQMPVSDSSRSAGSDGLADLGVVSKTIFDNDIDGAVIQLNSNTFNQITNVVPGVGVPQKVRSFGTNDINKENVHLCGATTKRAVTGKLTKVLTDVTIAYGPDHDLFNLLVFSNNGLGIADAGDSGACVLDSNNNVVGLVVAGIATETYVMPIDVLLSKFSMQLI